MADNLSSAIEHDGTARDLTEIPVPGIDLFLDPLDPDQPDDAPVLTTRRSLVRLALVASETASRFEREGVGLDPMAWMLAPRSMFDGRAALEACLDLRHCIHATLLHGLSLGLDATSSDLEALVDLDSEDPPRQHGDTARARRLPGTVREDVGEPAFA